MNNLASTTTAIKLDKLGSQGKWNQLHCFYLSQCIVHMDH